MGVPQRWLGAALAHAWGTPARAGPPLQAKVFQVAREDGSPTGKVIKINHADMASKMLNNNVVSAEHAEQ